MFRLLGALPAGLAAADEARLLGEDAANAVWQLRAVGLTRERAGRLDLLPPVRRHATAAHPPEMAEQRAWIAHYLNLARELGSRIGRDGGASASARIISDRSNIERAMRLARDYELLTDAVAAAPGYHRMAFFLGLNGDALLLLAESCQALGEIHDSAQCLAFRADVALARSEHKSAQQWFERAILLLRNIKQNRYNKRKILISIGNCTRKIAEIELQYRRVDVAEERLLEAFNIFSSLDKPSNFGIAECKQGLAKTAFERRRFDQSLDLLNQALHIFSKIPNKRGCANCHKNIARIELIFGNYKQAISSFESAKDLFQEIGALSEVANCFKGIGDVAIADSDYALARQSFGAALPIYREVSELVGEASCLAGQSKLAAAEGDQDEARRLIERAVALSETAGFAGNAA